MGFFKKIGKFFKKVVKSKVFQVIGAVVGVAAAVFTAGASLGITAAAGGWGAAASSLGAALGGTGTLGSIIGGAVTAAGYGSLMGGATSLLTGGNVLEGMAGGALGGAVTGGVLGGLGVNVDPLSGAFSDQVSAPAGLGVAETGAPATSSGFGSSPMPGADQGFMGSGFKPEAGGFSGATSRGLAPQGLGVAAQPAQPGFSVPGGTFLDRNQTLIGNTLSGLGQGLMAGGEAEDQYKNEKKTRDEQRGTYAGVDFSRETGRPAEEPTRRYPTASEKWSSREGTAGRYQWDRNERRIVMVKD